MLLPAQYVTSPQKVSSRSIYTAAKQAIDSYAVKFLVGIDDALDLFAEHAVGGILGLLFNALFADTEVIALDGVNLEVAGGWINHNWKQLYIQVAYICATCAYTFVMTALLAKGIDIIPGLKLRNDAKGEELGMDEVEVRKLLRFLRYHGVRSHCLVCR